MLRILFRSSVVFLAVLFYFVPCEAVTSYCPPLQVRVLFVNKCTTTPGLGTYKNPYADLKVALTASVACDVIYVFPNNPGDPYDAAGIGGFTLKPNQRLLGTSSQLFERCPNCPKPELINSVGFNTVQLSPTNNNEVSGFSISGNNLIQDNFSSIAGGATSKSIITNNDLTVTQDGGSGIIFASSHTNVGMLYIDSCNFYCNSIIECKGIDIGTLISNMIVTNNFFGGTIGLQTAITVDNNPTSNSILIQNNTINSQNNSSFGLSGIALLNPKPNAPCNVKILNNAITLSGPVPPFSTGIVVSPASINPGLPGSLICLTLKDNIVNTPMNTPGYLLINDKDDGSLFLQDSGNVGTFLFNNPAFPTNAPITFTSYECPDQPAIDDFLDTLPLIYPNF